MTTAKTTGAASAGHVLAAVLGTVAAFTGHKPLHARGQSYRATLRIDSPLRAVPVRLLAERGVHPCIVRLSRAVGTPDGWWDIGGLALRVEGAGPGHRPADLLFASTGLGSRSRHLLRPTRRPLAEPMTTLLPVRAGPASVLFLVRPLGAGHGHHHRPTEHPRSFELAASLDAGPWTPVGIVELGPGMTAVSPRFDPLLERLDGTVPPPWVTALREPAYAAARRLSRRETARTPGESSPAAYSRHGGML